MKKPESTPASIPDHDLLRCIGRGSYGEVWLARNLLGTLRAVKIVRRENFEQAADFEREFKGLRSFEPISRSHQGLCDILTLGQLQGESGFFYVMELADDVSAASIPTGNNSKTGRTEDTAGRVSPVRDCVDTYCARTLRSDLKTRGALPASEVIDLGLKLTSAVAYLHSQGLVHRDIKPSNILFIGNEPKLADAGLVTAVDEARSLVGTAGYIAPEGPGVPQADLYALGKVLYEAAFGKDRQDFPQLPFDLRSRPDHGVMLELNAVLLKACATNPRERYQSADEMIEDLTLLQVGSSVKRRQAWRRSVRHAMKFAVSGVALAVTWIAAQRLTSRSPDSSAVGRSAIPEAVHEYKMGINELHANLNAKGAIQHFDRAIQLDPHYADAYAQLADAWFSIPGVSNKDKGAKAAEKAVSIAPQSGLARVFWAASKTFSLDFATAKTETEAAVKLSPNSEEVLLASALNLAILGQTNDALVNLKKATEVGQDTPSKLRLIYTGFVYGWCRQYDRLIALYNETPWLRDDVDGPHQLQSLAYLAKDDIPSSIRLERQSALERGGNPTRIESEFAALDQAFKKGGAEGYWRQKLRLETPGSEEDHWMRMATIHARLKHRDEAFKCLNRAIKEQPLAFAMGIYTDPGLDALRDEQEFKELEASLWKKR